MIRLRRRPVIVSNRAPFEPGPDGRLKRGAGGVVTALLPLARRLGADWVANGPPGAEIAETGYEAGVIRYAKPDPEEFRKHYGVISNPILWNTQHYLWDLAREPRFNGDIREAWRNGYVKVNRQMAEVAAGLAGSRGSRPLFLVQDYQLYLVPGYIRSLLPGARIQHFTHIPWPTAQYWRVLPRELRDGIVDGLLGADVLGFQTSLDVHNFLLTCEENRGLRIDYDSAVVHVGRRTVPIRAYPISIDVEATRTLAGSKAVAAEEDRLRSWRPEHLIVRVDRTDPTKNVVRGFLAYERMLQDHPELAGRVQFWSFLQPSRQDVPGYRSLTHSITSTAERINAELGRNGWLPIRLELGENVRRAMAAYRNFDVLLVNSIFDGMNLVAKEGTLVNRRDGVLVLSENTGVHEELGDYALSVNPFEVDGTAEALYRALTMSDSERARRGRACREAVLRNDITRWINRQLEDLEELSRTARSA